MLREVLRILLAMYTVCHVGINLSCSSKHYLLSPVLAYELQLRRGRWRAESESLRAAGKVEAGFMVKDWLSAYFKASGS